MNYRKVKRITNEENNKTVKRIILIYGLLVIGYFVAMYTLLTYFLTTAVINTIKDMISWS